VLASASPHIPGSVMKRNTHAMPDGKRREKAGAGTSA
jgi:hypothetical protein